MKDSTLKQRDAASSRSEIRRISIKNGLTIILTSALLLAATTAVAGIIFVPVGARYANSELAPVNLQHLGASSVRIHTTGLNGELGLKCSDFPSEYELPASAEGVLTFIQQLDLIIDLAEGTVSGHASMDLSSPLLAQSAFVRGNASCLPLHGRDCGQLVVDLELRGALSDPNNPASVGLMRMNMLGSLIWDDTDLARWAAMSANATLGLNDLMINSVLADARCKGAL